jgi:hypothetical protein
MPRAAHRCLGLSERLPERNNFRPQAVRRIRRGKYKRPCPDQMLRLCQENHETSGAAILGQGPEHQQRQIRPPVMFARSARRRSQMSAAGQLGSLRCQ